MTSSPHIDRVFDAIENGRAAEVAEYVHRGGDLNATDSSGDTLLEGAAAYGRLEIVEILLAAGADPNRHGTWASASALALALENDHKEVCRALVAAGANVNVKLEDGMTILMCAVNSPDEDYDFFEVFLDAGADPNARCEGCTALYFAVSRGHENICRALAPLAQEEDRQRLLQGLQIRGGGSLLAHQKAEICKILSEADRQ